MVYERKESKTVIETERKYLITTPDFSLIEGLDGYSASDFEQTYLSSEKGVTRRVRLSRENGKTSYIYNEKRRISPISCIEDEREISEDEYRVLLAEKEPCTETVVKTRRTFLFGGQLFEIDSYPFSPDVCVCETELESESDAAVFPDFIQIIREVSGEKEYSNHSIAKRLYCRLPIFCTEK